MEKAERLSQLFTACKTSCFSRVVQRLGENHIKEVYKNVCRFDHIDSQNWNTLLKSLKQKAGDGLMTVKQFLGYKIVHEVVTLSGLKTKDGTGYKYSTDIIGEFYAKKKQSNRSCSKALNDLKDQIYKDQDMAGKRFKRIKDEMFPQNSTSKAKESFSAAIEEAVTNVQERQYEMISWGTFCKGDFDESKTYKLKFDVAVNGEDLRAMYEGLSNSKAGSENDDDLDDEDDLEDEDDSEDECISLDDRSFISLVKKMLQYQ